MAPESIKVRVRMDPETLRNEGAAEYPMREGALMRDGSLVSIPIVGSCWIARRGLELRIAR